MEEIFGLSKEIELTNEKINTDNTNNTVNTGNTIHKNENKTLNWTIDIESQLKSIEMNCSKMAQMNREEFLRLSQLSISKYQ